MQNIQVIFKIEHSMKLSACIFKEAFNALTNVNMFLLGQRDGIMHFPGIILILDAHGD